MAKKKSSRWYGLMSAIGGKADNCDRAASTNLALEHHPPDPSKPIDHRKPQRVVVVHGGDDGAGLFEPVGSAA
jgi:hypothetical protein